MNFHPIFLIHSIITFPYFTNSGVLFPQNEVPLPAAAVVELARVVALAAAVPLPWARLEELAAAVELARVVALAAAVPFP